jgi:hypothetical protein
MNIIRKVFLFCSGLKWSSIKSGDSQRVALGASVAFTSVFAAMSGFYALHFVFRSLLFSLPLALLWGFFILSVDRYVVTTLRRPVRSDKPHVYKRISQALNIAVRVFPRLLLGIFIAVVVAIPIELRLCESAINQQILTKLHATINQAFSQISELEKVNRNLLYQLQEKRREYQSHRDEAYAELEGTRGTLLIGAGPVFEHKRQLATRSEMEFADLRWSIEPEIIKNTSTIDSLSAERSVLINQAKRDSERDDEGTVLQRMEALRELVYVSPAIRWLTAGIMLLFVLLEIMPLLVRLLSKDSDPYDDVNFGVGQDVTIDVAGVLDTRYKGGSLQLGVLFLELVLPISKRDYLIGDLLEEYEANRENARNPIAPLLCFYKQVAISIIPLLVKMLTDIPARKLRK